MVFGAGGDAWKGRKPLMHEKAWAGGELLMLAASHGGVNLGFGLQYALLTPFVMELGVPKHMASFLWLGGPLTGMLVQPLVGRLSDSYSGSLARFGRRRPFLIVAMLVTLLAQILVGNCVDLGVFLGDKKDESLRARAAAVFTLGFWLLDAGSNGIIVTSRALLIDVVPESQMLQAFSAGTLTSGLGLALGYLVGGLSLSHLPGLRHVVVTEACGAAGGCADVRVAFMVASAVLASSTCCTVIIGHEMPAKTTDGEAHEEVQQLLCQTQEPKSLVAVICDDLTVLAVFITSSLTWFGWIATQMFQSHFVAEEIYGGSPDPRHPSNKLYVEGMHAASLALVVNALLMAASTMSFEVVRQRLGDKGLWTLGLQTTAILMALSLVVQAMKSKVAAWIWLAAMGPTYAVQLTLPYTILSTRAPENLQGQLQGYLNIAVCLPQLVLSLCGGQLLAWAGTDTGLFALGAVANVSAVAVWQLLPPNDKKPSQPLLQDPTCREIRNSCAMARKRGMDSVTAKGDMLDV
eukprot:CAMPEP_0197636396 /NCGR_PEP_ID=MMETSP1338-20131121/11912_1 /TAXON_ID=43686 ORGANISM="Pelagodinium beii, Strain RCC1491" /NCGR_SAMPLE_ID=MMETSP1338 /ASSEMBLY_ACC=CAM_ASM_000754 /LENGTH=519 /DNA_ID=CAMNT_0043208613 /DNA_START=1 /DNA_END=1560 /DNA_ORIENTATION=+